MIKHFIAFMLFIAISGIAKTQPLSTEPWKRRLWTAKWISHPEASTNGFGVYHFRRELQMDTLPLSYVVHVTGDNLFRLFVNGQMVCFGPARSDPANWNFETVDIAAFLKKGNNIIAATVWNFGAYRAYAQMSYETGFLLQGNSEAEFPLNTGPGWKVISDSSYQPLPIDRATLNSYLAVTSGEIVDGNRYPWGYELPEGSAFRWQPASELWYPAKPRSYGTDGNWQLVPRSIPRALEQEQEFDRERTGYVKQGLLAASFPWHFPARTKVSLLLDQGTLTNAYPQLLVSNGRNAVITLTYAEALVDNNMQKGNRNETAGKKLIGISDRYISGGGKFKLYSPLHYRTFRYVKVDIETRDEPLRIDKIDSRYTGYPFEERAKFSSSDPGLKKIWDVGWRTAKLCAVDTYMDCPYYEQLQYVGDTRIQALISMYVSGDDRLVKKAIDDIQHSFFSDGLTQSRYPSRDMQVIPAFSLWWVCMVHDHFMLRKDDAFTQTKLNGIDNVLRWYEERMAPKGGLLGPLSWWQFVDWSWPWADSIRVGGVPPGASQGGSSIITLQYAYTLARAAELMNAYGRRSAAVRYEQLAKKIAADVFRQCWDDNRKMLADTPEKNAFSQHANILGILTDAVESSRQKDLIRKILSDKSITQATYYFKFYLFEAMKKAGMGNDYLGQLKPWYDMLDIGLTTFAENPEPTRSDCHAWSASPVYEMLSMVAGIMPSAPGFKKVLIRPNLGTLSSIDASVPHSLGEIRVSISKSVRQSRIVIDLPAGLSGELEWGGQIYPLEQGRKEFQLPNG